MTAPTLSERQVAALHSLGTTGREVFAPDTSMRSLVTRGLATRRFIGMRWWYIAPTPAGIAILEAIRHNPGQREV